MTPVITVAWISGEWTLKHQPESDSSYQRHYAVLDGEGREVVRVYYTNRPVDDELANKRSAERVIEHHNRALAQLRAELAKYREEYDRHKNVGACQLPSCERLICVTTRALTAAEEQLAALRKAAEVLKDYCESHPEHIREIPDEVWVPFDAALATKEQA